MGIKFIYRLLLLSASLSVLTIVYFYFLNPPEQSWYWSALLYFVILGLGVGYRSHKAILSESNSRFYLGIMTGTGIRVFFSVIFIAIYLIVSDIKSSVYVGYYLFLYLLFTIFEIYQLVHKLRTEKKGNIGNATS